MIISIYIQWQPPSFLFVPATGKASKNEHEGIHVCMHVYIWICIYVSIYIYEYFGKPPRYCACQKQVKRAGEEGGDIHMWQKTCLMYDSITDL